MAFRRRPLAVKLLSRILPMVAMTSAFLYLLAATVLAQSLRVPIVAPSTAFEDAIVQIALYYDQPIGFELIDDDSNGTNVRSAPLDLSRLRFEDAIGAVLGRASRPYAWGRQGNAVFVRPAGADRDAQSWLNRPPGGPGVRTEIIGPLAERRTMFDRNMQPDLLEVTVSETWLELQRPGYSFEPARPNLHHEEIWRRYPEIGRRVSVVPESTVWDTLAAVMVAHGGIGAWTVAHPGARAVQGETTLEVVGGSGWWLEFPGLTPALSPTATMIGPLPENRFGREPLQDALPPPQLPAPPAVR